MKLNISAGLWVFGDFAERYVPGGYHDEIDFERQLEIMSGIEGLDGIGIVYPTYPLPDDPDKLVEKLSDFNLKVGDITVDNYGDRKWRQGAFSSNEEKIRKDNIDICKETIDFAAQIPGTTVTTWPAHDGFDYSFQTNYRDGWKYLVESYKEICSYNSNVKIAVEYKSKDPRQRQYVSNVGKTMMLLNDVDMDNIMAALDTGHALMSQENLAEDVVLLDSHDKLGTIHLNENYRDSDPDLIFGTIVFWENIEMYYYLNKTGFKGWNEIDIVSPRDDRIKSLKITVKMALKYKELADRLNGHSEVLDKNLDNYRFADNMELITDLIF